MSARGRIHHLDLTVSHVRAATAFYDRVLGAMGFDRGPDAADGPIWNGAGVEIGLQAARPTARDAHDRYSPGLHHVAFAASERADVDRVHAQLVAWGVEILDPPTDYPQYAPGYYAVFFAGPDGVKLEYVYTRA